MKLENKRLVLTCGVKDGRVKLRDKQTGLALDGGLCEMEMLWSPIQRIELQKDIRVTRAERLSATKARFRFLGEWSQIEFDLVIALDDNEFTVTVPWASLREHRQDFFRLFGVRPLPRLLTADKADVFVAPVRAGALIRPAKHTLPIKDRFLIYGQQPRWEDLPLLPVLATYTEGRHGIVAIAEQGDCDAQYEVEITRDGTAHHGFSTRYRYHWIDPVDPCDRVFRYVSLDPGDADYSGVGRRLRKHFRETWQMTTLTEKAERSPEVRYAAGALFMKTFHAQKDLGHEHGDGTYRVFQTFAETKGQLKKIRAAGVERAAIQLVGWNMDGHDGRFHIRFPVDPRLGGAEKFRELVAAGQRLGFQMQVHDNYADTHFPNHACCIQDIYGNALPRGIWGGGATYSANPLKHPRGWVRREMERLRALGVAGLYYLDAMSPPLEVDYDRKNGGPRRRQSEGLCWLLDQGRAVFGAAGTECGFAHIVRHADYIGDAPLRHVYAGLASATPVQSLVDEWIPLWHLAFHGLLIHTKHDDFVPSRRVLLEAAETGSAPRSDFSGAHPQRGGSMFAIQWDDRLLPAYAAKYRILCEQLGANQFAFIERHRPLGGDCYETTFSNGCVVHVDYEKQKLLVNRKEIAIPPVFDLNLPMRREKHRP
jgi:hypothetical protein